MKFIFNIFALLFAFVSLTEARSLVSWFPPAGGIKNTYTDSYKFFAQKGDVLTCRCYGSISNGSYVDIYITDNGLQTKIYTHVNPNIPFDETATFEIPGDGEFTLSYIYRHNGGGTAYSVKILTDLISPNDENFNYRLNNGNEVHIDGMHYKYDGYGMIIGKCIDDTYIGTITIPETVEYRGYTYPVKGISRSAFSGCTQLDSVFIPNSVEQIEKSVFNGCTKLKSVRLPEHINEIPDDMFCGCSSMERIAFPSSVTKIGFMSFASCSALTEINIPENVESIGAYSFAYCSSAKKVNLSNTVKELGKEAFKNCYGILSVTIGSGLEGINDAFSGCSSYVKELIFSEGCRTAFQTGLASITTLRLPTSLQEIDDEAFKGYKKLSDVFLPNSINRIGDQAFAGCEELVSINLPTSLHSIGTKAFYNCPKLTEIVIPGSLKSVSEETFSYCKSLLKVTIQDGVENISRHTFYNCSKLENINFPSSLRTIDEEAFRDCVSLSEVAFAEGLEYIGKSAFSGCSGLSKLSTPTSLISIGNSAFYNCSNLSELSITNGLQIIGSHAFCGCTTLKSIKLPDSVVSIGETAFSSEYSKDTPMYSIVQIGNGLKEIKDVFHGTNHNAAKIGKTVIGESISSITETSPIFGSVNVETELYLLTNNKVSLNCTSTLGANPCVYVANTQIYSEAEISKYGIKNIFSSTYYNGVYDGLAPNINLSSALEEYKVSISPEYFNVGTYTSLKVVLSKDDFSSTITVPCNYTITKAPLNIIANDKAIVYGEEIPELDCSYIGFKNGETADYALSTFPSLVTSAKKGSDAGTYKINISGAMSKNYSLSYTSGTLTIKKASQEITWTQQFNDCWVGDDIELNAKSSCGLPITYISSDESIAFVTNENGKQILHLIKDGNVKITATQQGNTNYQPAQEVSKSINVIAKIASSITLNRTSAELIEGETLTLMATIKPETAIEKGVVWQSSNNTIATVKDGVVTAHKVGNAIITATTIDGSNLSAICSIKVNPILATSITLNTTSASLKVGESLTLTCEIQPNNATYKSVQWSSSNTSIASISNGIVTAISPGSCVIKARTTDGSNLESTCVISVASIPVSTISFDNESIDLLVGEEKAIVASVYPKNATNPSLTWTSSNGNVVTVSNGKVKAVGAGNAAVSARTTDGSDITATCSVTVRKHSQTIEWNQNISSISYGGELIELQAVASSGLPIVFTSSDDNVVSIFNMGNAIYLNPGECGSSTITATQVGNYYYESASVIKEVKVVDPNEIRNIPFDNNYIVYSINGILVGRFTEKEYEMFLKQKSQKGLYIVNGKKTMIN